jgi:dTDP-4-dehydrorhamnose 3,5-epimerase
MKFEELKISGSWLATASAIGDARGSFSEWFRHDEIFTETGIDFSVAQANTSTSNRGVLRGLHFSMAIEGQSKWVGCMDGSLLDVMVDLRKGSPSFLEHFTYELDSNRQQWLLIPTGVAHGFLALQDDTRVVYLLTSQYRPREEYCLDALDEELSINWPEMVYLQSPKDRDAPTLNSYIEKDFLPKFFQ